MFNSSRAIGNRKQYFDPFEIYIHFFYTLYDLIKLSISNVGPLLIKKLRVYVDLFDQMDQSNVWLTYPDEVLTYFDKLGVVHWAELYFEEGIQKWAEDHKSQYQEWNASLVEEFGANPSTAEAESYLLDMIKDFSADGTFLGLDFLERVPDLNYINDLTDSEKNTQRDVFITFIVGFYNDLSIAAHGESIFSLVRKARDSGDADAFGKAIQIDQSIIKYFDKFLVTNQMKGNVDFFDALSYRVKNSPRKGAIKHPLLWILFKDLLTIERFLEPVTSVQILTLYHGAVGEHDKFGLLDEQTVQRQRRKFARVYRQMK